MSEFDEQDTSAEETGTNDATSEQDSGSEHQWPEWIKGDPDPKRLAAYADNLRQERARDRGVWEDEDAVFGRVKERFPHWFEADEDSHDGDDDFEDDDSTEPTPDPRVDALVQRLAQKEFQDDLKEIVADRSLNDRGREWLDSQRITDKAALKKAVDTWFEFEDSLRGDGVDKLRQSKKAPTPPVRGRQANDKVPDLDDRNERRRWMAEQHAARTAQQ